MRNKSMLQSLAAALTGAGLALGAGYPACAQSAKVEFPAKPDPTELPEVWPEQAGVSRATLEDLKGGDAQENALELRSVLHGRMCPYRDIVVLNAAAALIVAGKADGLRQGAELARQSIDSGAAAARLDALVRATNRVPA